MLRELRLAKMGRGPGLEWAVAPMPQKPITRDRQDLADKEALEDEAPDLQGHIVVMDWC